MVHRQVSYRLEYIFVVCWVAIRRLSEAQVQQSRAQLQQLHQQYSPVSTQGSLADQGIGLDGGGGDYGVARPL